MGYRSDVVIAITKETSLKYEVLLSKFNWVNEVAEGREVMSNGNIYWYINSIKWYDSFEPIQQLIDTFDLIEEDEDPNILHAFMRTGEDTTDQEYSGYPHEFEMYFTHSIETPLGII
jgi:hypothetical protein